MSPYVIPGVRSTGILTFEDIEEVVCAFYDVPRDGLYKRSRKMELVWPRFVICYFAVELLHIPLMEIGRRMARDHTTVLYARRMVQNRKHTEQLFSAEVEELRKRLMHIGL